MTVELSSFERKLPASFRERVGAVIYDLPRFVWSMRPSPRNAWIYFCNRDEKLLCANEKGVACGWRWTSDLHLAKVYPSLGRHVMKRALREWPIELGRASSGLSDSPEVSFIIGHRGAERLPHLRLTLESIKSQRHASVECIVVEQSVTPEIARHLPGWVKYVHTGIDGSMPYCRAWAFNVGARIAKGEVVVLHDNDLLVPREYAKEVRNRFEEGFEVINLKRMIFCFSSSGTRRVIQEETLSETPESIVQNAQGGSLAVSRDAYLELGGFDEEFVGWGGEDNEFWERAQTRRVWSYGYLPFVHLWHPSQPGKFNPNRATAGLYERRSGIPPADRIAELIQRDFGRLGSLAAVGWREIDLNQTSCVE
jgi:hypothetical protein